MDCHTSLKVTKPMVATLPEPAFHTGPVMSRQVAGGLLSGFQNH